jgi:uncharacterized 2Fe-2S/4Fe-4S cluster protein (DUF4445 family)
MNKIEIRFLPGNKLVQALQGSNLLDLAREARIEIESSCNGHGTCGKCLIRQVEGDIDEPHPDEFKHLSGSSLAQGVRLACRVKTNGNAAFTVIHSSGEKGRILSQGFMPQFDLDPEIRKLCLELPIPALEDAIDDISRIERMPGLQLENVPLAVLRELPGILRDTGYKATFVLSGGRLLGVESGDTSLASFGVAVDIGTTTVVASLHDLSTGLELAACSGINPQKTFGLDVLSRIQHVREKDQGLENLQRAIIESINSLIEEASLEAGIDRKNIYEVSIAANSTMMHLFLGIDPSSMGRSPYVPVFIKSLCIPAADLGINISPFGEIYCLPSVSSYVGSDITAGILCTELYAKDERALFIDIGTNGEIVFSSGSELFACSCAAGPALEGMNISCGMRATDGAIEKIEIEDTVEICTIGGKPAKGICGSGLIDAVGELLKKGIINKSGRFEKSCGGNMRDWNDRLRDDEGKISFVLNFGQNGVPSVMLTQKDIRQVQLAKGAILSGILTLISHLNASYGEIDRVYIAGAFGCHIRMENFARLGVLPPQLLDRVVLVGNTSKSGAALCLLSRKKRAEVSAIAGKIHYVELSCYPGFDRVFAQALSFPEIKS